MYYHYGEGGLINGVSHCESWSNTEISGVKRKEA